MITVQKRSSFLKLAILWLALTSFAGQALGNDAVQAFDDDMDLFTNPDIEHALEETHFDISMRAVPTEEVADALVDLNAIGILQQDFYLATYPLNYRNILDSPLFLFQRCEYIYDWLTGFDLFFNQMSRARFTKDSTAISSYLAINSPDLLRELQTALDTIDLDIPNFSIDPINVFPLFENMTIQERKMGMMMHIAREFYTGELRVNWPLYYIERNFFLTESEQEALEAAFGQANQEDTELFAKQHLISDKFGLGDMRVTYHFRVLERETSNVWLGLQTSLPTSFAISEGLLGSTHTRQCNRPVFDFTQLFTLGQGTRAQREQATAIGEAFLLGTLDNLAANLLEPSLGYNGHAGLGAYFQSQTALTNFIKQPWAINFIIKSRMSLEYLLPAHNTRWFIEQSNLSQFEEQGLTRPVQEIKDEIAANPAYAEQVVAFLQNQFINKFYPFALRAKVFPGFIYHSTTKFFYEGYHYGCHLGSDFWLQGREKLRDIQVNPSCGPANIDLCKATKPLAYESKVHGSFFYKVRRSTMDWTLGVNGDWALWGTGIGEDFTVSFCMEANF